MYGESETNERLTAFVRHNWLALAAAAWRNHMKWGRGFTLLDWRAIEAWEKGAGFTVQPPYVTDAGHEQANAIIEKYRPETSIVVAVTSDSGAAEAAPQHVLEPPAAEKVLRAGESLGVWIFEYEPAPPAAHSQTSH